MLVLELLSFVVGAGLGVNPGDALSVLGTDGDRISYEDLLLDLYLSSLFVSGGSFGLYCPML